MDDYGYERHLENYLFERPNAIDMKRWIGRQMKMPNGILDLLGISIYDKLSLVELKVVPYNPKHITQLNRYQSSLMSIAIRFGYMPLNIEKILIVPDGKLTNKDLIEIRSSDVWIMTYKFEPGLFDYYSFDEPLNLKPIPTDKVNVDTNNNSIRNYLNYLRNHSRGIKTNG